MAAKFLIFAFLISQFSILTSVARAQTSTPYSGTPWPIPGIIEVEDFDLGGEGTAYHDLDSTNNGGQYRTAEGVDIGETSDGAGGRYEVGWTQAGEWLQYSVEVATTGTYSLTLRAGLVGYATGQGELHLEVDGVNVTGTMKTYTGLFWWQGYSTITVTGIRLTAGPHKLKLVLDKNASVGVGSLNWMLFDITDPPPAPVSVIYPDPVQGNIFYVAPGGNDNNPGTLALPWKTLAKAANALTPGQTVYIRAGIYRERLTPKNSGNQTNYIIYMAYPGEIVTIDGTGISIPPLEGLINVTGKRFIRISGLRVINSGVNVADGTWNMGISVQKADHVIIDGNFVSHIYSLGIDINQASSFIVVDNNEVTDANFGDTDGEVSLGVFWFSHDLLIKNNRVHHGKNEGIGAAAGVYDVQIHHNAVHHMGIGSDRIAIYIDAWTEHQYNIDVGANTVYDNTGQGIIAASEGGGLLENVNFFNNIVYNVGYSWGGIGIAPWTTTSSPTHPVQNINFINNTVYNNAGGGIVINNPEVKNIIIRNNIFYQNLTGNIKIDPVVPASEIIQDHNLTVNPQFINATAFDFHLKSTSPAIDAGSNLNAPNIDFDGLIRPAGSGYDVGAFEFGSTSPPASTPTPTPKTGDANSDGKIDGVDYMIWFNHYRQSVSGPSNGDFNSSGLVDGVDYMLWFNNYGR
ncbi:MAG: pectate lyase-like protein [Candidatus Amesbacteria bacterium GW2011_GWB1_47_19]|nr:MAG: pectate lyase-like protein [Candidatus Amesbacteria bacterium GW2011_GWA1_44_24]KKU30832.1 MAG: pectate lyase-like protein [Candidatus Amesbacteria bacterium GW2011_GWC1_46_24]KKU66530.1 MAG: pectate lyase-like protein [Candidatus Amesbacteria bacterium GW2011_GWB1_47_19]OGD06538.1 MAG: hypothetical protein A2379_00195 [Candidatus Amesbacteria bacterium RIFOXYB1_FULL_47_13]HBC72920.1 hypothetical protein [Candidatus Amesbacteria bacterium]